MRFLLPTIYSKSIDLNGTKLEYGLGCASLEMLVCLAVQTAEAAKLKKETAAAFDRYVGASEERIKAELHNGLFLLN